MGVLLTSISGSLHCVGMCSGLMMNVAKTSTENALYHLGRLLGYLALGALAGALGQSFFQTSFFRSFQLLTSVGIALLFFWTAIRVWKNQALHFNLVPTAILSKLQIWSLNRKWISPAFLVGLTTGLLPCGWLHTFVIAALATQSSSSGALLLFFFWLGTIPALAGSRLLLEKMSAPLARSSAKILAVLFLIAGLGTLALKCYPLLGPPATVDSCPLHPGHS